MSHSLHNYAYIPMDIRPVMLRLASFGFHPTNIPVVYVLCVCSICSINNAVRNGFILGMSYMTELIHEPTLEMSR